MCLLPHLRDWGSVPLLNQDCQTPLSAEPSLRFCHHMPVPGALALTLTMPASQGDTAARRSSRLLTVQPEVFEAAIRKVIFHDRHEGGHLAEQQHFVVGGAKFGEDSIKKFEFARGTIQVQPGVQRQEGHSVRRNKKDRSSSVSQPRLEAGSRAEGGQENRPLPSQHSHFTLMRYTQATPSQGQGTRETMYSSSTSVTREAVLNDLG